jgi:hypothetical protein
MFDLETLKNKTDILSVLDGKSVGRYEEKARIEIASVAFAELTAKLHTRTGKTITVRIPNKIANSWSNLKYK